MSKLRLVTPNPTLRAAIYSRYSSDVQNDRSIERQIADLETAAPRHSLILNKRLYFEDRGTTATTLFDRPGLTRRLLEAAEKKLFDVVFVEHTDRLAREPADAYWLKAQLKFHNIRVFTPANGEVTDIQWCFESYQNAADSAKTSFRVRSGHNDAAREGFIPGPAAYGYEDVIGKPGEKDTNASAVEIVNRIVFEIASRKSPRQIAFDLTRDGVPSPKGGAWTFQTINKILQNELYVGVYVRNKVRKIRNPNTGKRIPRPSPDEVLRVEMPRLRIVDQGIWEAAQKIRQERAHIYGKKGAERATVARRLHPFAGLFRCAECGGKMIICGTGRKGDRSLACSSAWWKRSCSHGRSYSLSRLTKHATEKMHAHLTDPEFVNREAQAHEKELTRLDREAGGEREVAQRELDRVDLRIRKIIRLIEDDESDDVPQEVQDRYRELRVEQRGLQQRLALLEAKSHAPLLPSAIKALAKDVDTLHAMLIDNPDDPACRIALGNLIERALVHPAGSNQPYDVSLYARHAAYAGTLPLFPMVDSNPVRKQALNRINRDNAMVPSLPISERPILLGRWQEGTGERIKVA